MKKVKVIAVALVALIMLSVTAPAALAANNDSKYYEDLLNGYVDTDKFKEIFGGLIGGGNGNGTSSVGLGNLSEIINILKERLGGSYNVDQILDALKQVFGDKLFTGGIKIDDIISGDIIAQIKNILSGETTTVPATEPATEAPTEAPTAAPTEPVTEPATEAPTRAPYNPSRSDPAEYTVAPTTEEDTTFSYIPPEKVTVPIISNESTTYNVYDDTDTGNGGVTAKMVIGIIILVLSGAAVVVVAVILKKSRV